MLSRWARRRAFQSCGAVEALGELQMWSLGIKPGKPFAYGRIGDAHVTGLPGNPVSSFMTFVLLVRPFLLALQGAQRVAPPAAGARPPRAPGAGGRALQARAFSRRLRGGLGLSGGCEGGAVPAQPEVLVPGWALGRGARAREDASE